MKEEILTTALPPSPLTGSGKTPRHSALFLAVVALLFTLVAGFLFLSNNRFSCFCHPDEWGKVRQIQSGERNFHHPMLMLNTVQAVYMISGLEPKPQTIVWLGRSVTAGFALATVLLFSAAAYAAAGRLAGILCGVFLLTVPLLTTLAHFFKEDPAMTMGLGVSFLAMALYMREPNIRRLGLLALGLALAASGKHIGVLVIPFGFYTVLQAHGGPRRCVLLAGLTLFLYALINYQIVFNWPEVMGGLNGEITLIKAAGACEAEAGRVRAPLLKYLTMVRDNFSLPLLWFFAYGVWSWRRAEKTPLGRVVVFTLLVFALLSLVPKTAARYMLPVFCGFAWVAAVGAARIWERRDWKWRTAGFVLPLAMALALSIPQVWAIHCAFEGDTRLQMAQWIARNIPADALIAQDAQGLLENASVAVADSPYKVPQPLFDAGKSIWKVPIETLRSQGVRYLVARAGGKPADADGWARLKPVRQWGDDKGLLPLVCPKLILFQIPPG